jgi:hypothetical protein
MANDPLLTELSEKSANSLAQNQQNALRQEEKSSFFQLVVRD